nr:AAA family ATPase [Thiomicrorhabdus sp.]
MSILIDEVRILGFRGISNLKVNLPRVSVLIGTNNSGKTSLLRALHLVFGDYSRFLSVEDFHIAPDKKRVEEIRIDVRIIPVDCNGNRMQPFNEAWQSTFGDKIQAEANGLQFVALRTRCKSNEIKGGFDTLLMTLDRWPDADNWPVEKVKESKPIRRIGNMPFIFIDAQRDIHQELREKSSFVGRVLSRVDYDQKEISELEALIKQVNDRAVDKSEELKKLKTHLDNLNQSFQGSGNTEISPFPKKIRDLSKHFSVDFGESASNSFSMEYHGMGTRSWASMLTAKAFIDMIAESHEEEEEPFFPILAIEEPEAHLHPSAQKTLYKQLAESKGQIFVSTHSPYLAAMADQAELRHLKIASNKVEARSLTKDLAPEDKRRLQREVMQSRGEIIFSKALVLCEGETEEQSLPLLFKKYFGHDPFVLGVSFIGVGGSGKKYLPFLTFARDLNSSHKCMTPNFLYVNSCKFFKDLIGSFKFQTFSGPVIQ